jgi:hypothetical protein
MDLFNHYKYNFDITQYHKFLLDDVNHMIPFERELYMEMLEAKNKKEQEGNGAF